MPKTPLILSFLREFTKTVPCFLFRLPPISSSSSFYLEMRLELNSIKKTALIGQVLDPNGEFLLSWNRIFLVIALVALFIDPLYFYVPYSGGYGCLSVHRELFITFTTMRSLTDMFYLFHIFLKLHTAYVLPGSTVMGKGELVMDARKIAYRYLRSDFIVDLTAVIPIPQIVYAIIWGFIPNVGTETAEHSNNGIGFFILIQYVPRFIIIFPLHRQIIANSGVVTKTAWGGAAYNLFLYMLASHVFGASWYLQSIERQYVCWSIKCHTNPINNIPCRNTFFDCKSLNDKQRSTWLNNTSVFLTCDAKQGEFKYGIFKDALATKLLSTTFLERYLYCLWWGLNNVSSFGQNLSSSGYISETAFCMFICIVGVLLFCHLIANIQTYLQSMTTSFEVWREKTKVTDKWMKQRGLPLDLQERIHKYLQYKWSATNGVDEVSIMQSLPLDFRRNVRRHVCLDLIHRVHFFSHMDNLLQDAICERLVSSLSIAGAFIIREGDPVEEILFILRGKLESSTTNGGRYGFLNSSILGPGDYCGEELLTWALKPNPSQVLPSSTRTVQALTDIDAFALQAADLKYVANQFKRLHSKKLLHIFRFHSDQWRTWAASYVQAAWRRFKKSKLLEGLLLHVRLDSDTEDNLHARSAKLSTTCQAIFHMLSSWRRVRKRKYSQILEMCESFCYLQNQEDAVGFEYAECSSMEQPIIEIERLEEGGELMDRSTGGESSSMEENSNRGMQLRDLVLASQFYAKLIGVRRKIDFIVPEDYILEMLKLRKPQDPDFSKHIDSG